MEGIIVLDEPELALPAGALRELLHDAPVLRSATVAGCDRLQPGSQWAAAGVTEKINHRSLTSLQERLVKHDLFYWLLLAEAHLTPRMFETILWRIWAPLPTG